MLDQSQSPIDDFWGGRWMGSGCSAKWFLMVVSTWDHIKLPREVLPKSHAHLKIFLHVIISKPCASLPPSLPPSLHLPLCCELLSPLKGSCHLVLSISIAALYTVFLPSTLLRRVSKYTGRGRQLQNKNLSQCLGNYTPTLWFMVWMNA